MGVQSQARAKSVENRSHSIMAPGIQQLQQEGFGPGQIRALTEFVQSLIDRTVQPIVERFDQRFAQVERRLDRVDQHLEQVDQHLERVDQHLERVDQHLEQVDQHLERIDQHLERTDERFEHVDRHFEHIERRFTMLSSQLENLQESIRGLQRWSWMPYLVMGLAFAGLYFALFAIWLGMVRNAA